MVSSSAQTPPAAAVQPLALSTFGGLTGTYTGLSGGKNLGLTAGVDLRVYTLRHYLFSGEVRGTYPIDGGAIDSEKNFLAGAKVDRIFHQVIDPYADILVGRGVIDYLNGGYVNAADTLIYTRSPSTVISPGAGVDIALTGHFWLKLDGQFQHWDTPVTASGSLYSTALTAAAVYRFDFNHHNKYPKQQY